MSFGFEILFLNELSLWTRILCVNSSKVCYYLELKEKEDRVLERQKGKDNIHENNKDVYSYWIFITSRNTSLL